MPAAEYQEAYTHYLTYYRTATLEQLAALKERTRNAAASFADRPNIRSFADGKVAAIDKLIAKLTPAKRGMAEQQQFLFCAVCGRSVSTVRGWKRCGWYGWQPVCIKHCADTCHTIFGEHCVHSGTHAPTVTSRALFDPHTAKDRNRNPYL